jgi:hypothetical protein
MNAGLKPCSQPRQNGDFVTMIFDWDFRQEYAAIQVVVTDAASPV